MQVILCLLFWISELIVLALVVMPCRRFLSWGWNVRKQEFSNRLRTKTIDLYLDRFWDQSLRSNKSISGAANIDKFLYVYDIISGRGLYTLPLLLLSITLFVFSGLVISTAIRSGYEQYMGNYILLMTSEGSLGPVGLIHLTIDQLNNMVLPFSGIDLSIASVAAVSGAYLYVVGVVIKGYRTRTLLSSDLWWCSFRLLISIPLGFSLASIMQSTLSVFIAFSLGAFPIDAITRLLRRLSYRALNASEERDDSDQLIRMLGVTPNVAAQLSGEGVESVQQLSGIDPVSLALRTGLSFEHILNLVSQSQAWKYIGSTAGTLAPLGLGDARIIALLMDAVKSNDPIAIATLEFAAKQIKMDVRLLTFNFRNIAQDKYTVFLRQFSTPA